jgi:hypothetical protein
MNTKIIKTEALLHLNWEIFIFIVFFIYLFLIFIFHFQSSVSLMPVQLTVD